MLVHITQIMNKYITTIWLYHTLLNTYIEFGIVYFAVLTKNDRETWLNNITDKRFHNKITYKNHKEIFL